eukprot:superscaffoldBa00002778_g15258
MVFSRLTLPGRNVTLTFQPCALLTPPPPHLVNHKSHNAENVAAGATRMDLNNVRRVSSAGYRLPQRSSETRPISTQPPADKSRYAKGDAVSAAHNPDRSDTVKQDQVWKESVWSERRGVREW